MTDMFDETIHRVTDPNDYSITHLIILRLDIKRCVALSVDAIGTLDVWDISNPLSLSSKMLNTSLGVSVKDIHIGNITKEDDLCFRACVIVTCASSIIEVELEFSI